MKKWKEKLSEAMEIPKEISMDYPKTTLIGNRELYVENAKAVVTYTDVLIQLHTQACFLKIRGKNLQIRQITAELIEINGEISVLELEN